LRWYVYSVYGKEVDMKGFHVISGEGTHYTVIAEDLKAAYDKFRAWERKEFFSDFPADEEVEEPQSIMWIGDVIQ
jgi:hypothetical protein